MTNQQRQALRSAAAECLTPDHRKPVLIWAGVSGGLSLVVSLLSLALESGMGNTGGLSGIGLRSILSTAQSVLNMAVMLLLPFWNLGYTSFVLKVSRQKPAGVPDLLEGFRRFGPALRLFLLRYLLYSAVTMGAMYLSVMVLSMTPLGRPLFALFMENQELLMSGTADEAMAMAIIKAGWPLFAACGVVAVAAIIAVAYRIRLADLRLMDEPRCGALAALMESARLMRGRCMDLLRLDLSFWWFYLAQAVVLVLNYGDVLLPLLGVTLPFGETAAFYVFYIAAQLLQLWVMYLFSNRVQVTYAKFYDSFGKRPAMPVPVENTQM